MGVLRCLEDDQSEGGEPIKHVIWIVDIRMSNVMVPESGQYLHFSGRQDHGSKWPHIGLAPFRPFFGG